VQCFLQVLKQVIATVLTCQLDKIVFQKRLYQNKQLTTLFAMQEVLNFFPIIHFYKTMQDQSNFTEVLSTVIMQVYS